MYNTQQDDTALLASSEGPDHPPYHNKDFCEFGLTVIETEAQAIKALGARIDDTFAKACQLLLRCQGRIIVIGMGKSGHISRKIAATLASTGSPAFFVHPSEASHGDLGMLTRKDTVIMLSNSGETPEILTLLPIIQWLGLPIISMTGKPNSTLARTANVNLDVSVALEACPLGLAPTASTTAALVMGDALAIALLRARGFTAEDFAKAHPGGLLGQRLAYRVDELMRTGNAVPQVKTQTLLKDALREISEKRMGMTAILNERKQLLGIFTDGDLRRTLDTTADLTHTIIDDVMTRHCKTILPDCLAIEALQLMEHYQITGLFVLDPHDQIVGAIHLHDLLRAGVAS